MSCIVDANVLKAFYNKTVLDIESELTGCPKLAFDKLDSISIDLSGHIEHEWKSLVDREWFDSWLSSEIILGRIQTIEVENHMHICNAIYREGFPKGSKDIWYIRTAKQLSIIIGENSTLITEDMDFFDPTKKSLSGNARLKIMKNKKTCIKKILEKESINILCIFNYLRNL